MYIFNYCHFREHCYNTRGVLFIKQAYGVTASHHWTIHHLPISMGGDWLLGSGIPNGLICQLLHRSAVN